MRERSSAVVVGLLLATPDEHDQLAVPAFAERMAEMWRTSFAKYANRYTNIGSVTGLGAERAANLLSGKSVANRREAAILDHALQTDASAFFPKHSGSVPQNGAPPRTAARSDRGHILSMARQSRIDRWAKQLAAYGRGVDELADETKIPPERLAQILRCGARMDGDESLRLQGVLGRNEALNINPLLGERARNR